MRGSVWSSHGVPASSRSPRSPASSVSLRLPRARSRRTSIARESRGRHQVGHQGRLNAKKNPKRIKRGVANVEVPSPNPDHQIDRQPAHPPPRPAPRSDPEPGPQRHRTAGHEHGRRRGEIAHTSQSSPVEAKSFSCTRPLPEPGRLPVPLAALAVHARPSTGAFRPEPTAIMSGTSLAVSAYEGILAWIAIEPVVGGCGTAAHARPRSLLEWCCWGGDDRDDRHCEHAGRLGIRGAGGRYSRRSSAVL
jgi:hypothetical protein